MQIRHILIKDQIQIQWTIEEISIFSNSSHLEWRTELSDTILKWDYPRTIPAISGLIWFSGFREEDLNLIFSLTYIPGFSLKYFFQSIFTDYAN
jgi:hypothetical protein